jgi:hypothetical protein|tara:strand:+ start:347 stop:574 length:228 start_codon:yes stop_codon:yes gene_type:complete
MMIAVYVFVVLGAFLMGTVTSWVAKDHIDAFIDNAAYAKAVTHPEMLNSDGTVDQSELLTLSFLSEEDFDDDDDL